ncbi:ABC transporter permease [Litorihabitans aurantiacus]|uniref:ABC transporter permease n=1 Tax=Litorihabitans aurantiacus TaxID=1930061 RepID=A0AA37UUH3_9MICO|nr:ABC transporter permease [Litorihabitans aurantiacus]GMA30516.1 ABC transporter permease [Litorihabitans aurantiacus]
MSAIAPSTSTADRVGRPAPRAAGTGRVTFGHLLASEWIKLLTLRSTWWTLGLTVLGMVGLAALSGAGAGFAADSGLGDGFGLSAITFGYWIGQISVAVLGALIITGEYSTGMIRSTMAAAPRRVDALLAKAGVLVGVVAATAVLGIALSYLVTLPLLAPHDLAVDLGASDTWLAIGGAVAYLVLISLLAFGLGVIVRSSAGSIAAILGIVLMLPTVLSIVSVWQSWAMDVMAYLPSEAGGRMITGHGGIGDASMPPGATLLDPAVGGLVMLSYVVVVLAIAITLLKKRDV